MLVNLNRIYETLTALKAWAQLWHIVCIVFHRLHLRAKMLLKESEGELGGHSMFGQWS